MAIKRGKKSYDRMKDLPARKLTAKQARGIKGGDNAGATDDHRNLTVQKVRE